MVVYGIVEGGPETEMGRVGLGVLAMDAAEVVGPAFSPVVVVGGRLVVGCGGCRDGCGVGGSV